MQNINIKYMSPMCGISMRFAIFLPVSRKYRRYMRQQEKT